MKFFVPGVPVPGGSKRAFAHARTGKIIVQDMGKGNKEWRDRVAFFARAAKNGQTLMSGPLHVSFFFLMPRPKGHYGTGKHAGQLKTTSPRWHTIRPDTTKLIRAAEDALTGVIWTDDAVISTQLGTKQYANNEPGVVIVVEELKP